MKRCFNCHWYHPVESDTHVIDLCRAHTVTTSGEYGLQMVERKCAEILSRHGGCTQFVPTHPLWAWIRYPGNALKAICAVVVLVAILLMLSN